MLLHFKIKFLKYKKMKSEIVIFVKESEQKTERKTLPNP